MNTLSIGWLLALLKPNVNCLSKSLSSAVTLLVLLLPAVALAQQSMSGSASSQMNLFGGDTGPSIKFEQGQNGGVSSGVVSPVNWVAGNGNGTNSHFSEGQSIPYRLTLANVAPGTHTVIVEWDLRRDKKTAIDYVTSFQRIGESVDPLRGLAGSYGQPAYFTIPTPQRNRLVTGSNGTQAQPAYSFNKLPAAERQIAIYNASPSGIAYFYEGDPADWYAPTKMKFTFKVLGTTAKTVVLAWGGHIATRSDWGAQNVYTDMYSSPYRSMIISLDTKWSFVDRSLQVSALKPTFVPSCEVKGNITFCSDIAYEYTVVSNIAAPIYEWTVTGGAIQKGQGTSLLTVKWSNVAQGSIAVKVKDQNNATILSNCMLTLTRDVVCPYVTPSVAGKVETPLGPELTSLHANFQPGATSNFIYTLLNDKVLIEVIANAGEYATLLNLLKSPAYGLTGEVDNDNQRIITGFFPIANLLSLNNLPTSINYVRPAYPPARNVGTITTKGDIAQRSNLVRTGYGLTGKGVKVGVLSDSYNRQPNNPAATNVANNDLSFVHVLKDAPDGSDEGRAMLQLVHDIAPDAKLAFRTGVISSGDFAKGIKELQQDTCDIIVDDLTYLTEPFFQDGQVANTVDLVTSQGVTYFTSAGNYGNKSYESTFAPAAAPTGVTGSAHDFSGGDIFQKVTLGAGTYTIVLQWEDPIYSLGQTQTGTLNDLDLYLTTDAGATLFGFNRNNLGSDPIEVLTFTVREASTTNIMIVRSEGTTNVKFKYVVFRGDEFVFNEHNSAGSSTIVGQANSKGAITVGAVLYSNTEAYGYKRPANAGAFTVASFSSIGGMSISGQDRQKPDIIAPNGGNTTVRLGGLDVEYDIGPTATDGFFNFFGTSASAPHAAGVAALLMQARKKYYNGERYTPTGIRDVLKSTAVNMHEPGYDVKSGAGFIQADLSMRSIAAPLPELVVLNYDSANVEPGKEQFVLTVNGSNLTPESKVFMRDIQLPTTYVGPTQLQTVISPFEGNPPIHVYTAAFSPSGLDGGSSDTLYFKDRRLIPIEVVAENKTKKYGEILPAFTATIIVDGDTLTAESEISAEDLGLTDLLFTTPANSMSNADKWVITVTKDLPVPLQELYDYTFTDGLLTIEKLPLQIRPNDLQVQYGEKFDDKITFAYQFDGMLIESPQTIINNLKTDHKAILVPNAIALVDSRAIANGSRPLVNADLQNFSFLASSRAIANSRPIVNRSRGITNSTNVVDFDKQSMLDYFDNPDTASLITPIFNSRAIVNASRALVNSRAIVNSRALVNYSKGIVNASRALVNSRAIVNGGAVVNSETVGDDDTHSNSDAVVIIDSTDVFNTNPPIIVDGLEVYELPALFSINVATGLTAGNHFIVSGAYLTDLSNNFDVTYIPGNLRILKDTLTIAASSAEILYGVTQPSYMAAVTGYQYEDNFAAVINSIVFGLKDQNGNNNPTTGAAPAGIYQVVPTVTLKQSPLQPGEPVNYVTRLVNGSLTVNRVPLVIKASDIIITAGETPQYKYTQTGIVNGDVIVGGPQYSTSPTYAGLPGTYTITPKNVIFAVPGNYDIQYETGTLFVNPKINLCKAVRPILRCVEVVSGDPVYTFRARFEYQNENSTAVMIPVGPENSLVSAGAFSGTPPAIFQPGGGSFDVLFTGQKLTWTIIMYDKGRKTAIASSASSTSMRCKNGNDGSMLPLTAYPNPVDRFTTVYIPDATKAPSYWDVVIMDQGGRKYPVSMEWAGEMKTLTFDMWYYPKGFYVINIRMSGGTKQVKLYKN